MKGVELSVVSGWGSRTQALPLTLSSSSSPPASGRHSCSGPRAGDRRRARPDVAARAGGGHGPSPVAALHAACCRVRPARPAVAGGVPAGGAFAGACPQRPRTLLAHALPPRVAHAHTHAVLPRVAHAHTLVRVDLGLLGWAERSHRCGAGGRGGNDTRDSDDGNDGRRSRARLAPRVNA